MTVQIRPISFLPHPEAPLERQYRLMGERLKFRSNHTRLLAAADEAFLPYGEPPEQNGLPMLEIRLLVDHSLPSASVDLGALKPVYRQQGHLFSLQVGSSFAMADLRAGFAYGFLAPELLEDLAYVRYTFIEALGLAMLGLARGYAVVHAACVARSGTAILLAGPSGSGKSTLTYACLRRGFQLLAEDAVQVKVLPERLELWGAPWKLHLLPDAVELYPELGSRYVTVNVNGKSKLELSTEQLFPGAALRCTTPGFLVSLERAASSFTGRPRLEFIDPNAVHEYFDVVWSWQTGWSDHLAARLHALVSGGFYRLHLAGHPDVSVDLLDELLESCSPQPEQPPYAAAS